MTANFANAGIFLVQTFFGLYLILILVRLLMQVSRADYYNPICQAVVRLTDPLIRPLKQLLPSIRGIDLATLLVALLVQIAAPTTEAAAASTPRRSISIGCPPTLTETCR